MSSSSSGGTSSIGKAYIKEREVSRGQHAKVYMAREVGTRRSLAVKVFDKPASLAEDMRRRQAIKHELKMLDAVRNGVSAASKTRLGWTPLTVFPASYYRHWDCTLFE